MSDTPEHKYFRHSRRVGTAVEEELRYWTQRIVAGTETARLSISVGGIQQGTTINCMKMLELFCKHAEEKENAD